jgi:hypothetical protein
VDWLRPEPCLCFVARRRMSNINMEYIHVDPTCIDIGHMAVHDRYLFKIQLRTSPYNCYVPSQPLSARKLICISDADDYRFTSIKIRQSKSNIVPEKYTASRRWWNILLALVRSTSLLRSNRSLSNFPSLSRSIQKDNKSDQLREFKNGISKTGSKSASFPRTLTVQDWISGVVYREPHQWILPLLRGAWICPTSYCAFTIVGWPSSFEADFRKACLYQVDRQTDGSEYCHTPHLVRPTAKIFTTLRAADVLLSLSHAYKTDIRIHTPNR